MPYAPAMTPTVPPPTPAAAEAALRRACAGPAPRPFKPIPNTLGPRPRDVPGPRRPVGDGPRPYKRPMHDCAPVTVDGVLPGPGPRGAYTRVPPRRANPRSPYALNEDHTHQPSYTKPQPHTPTTGSPTPLTRSDYRSLGDRVEALTRECQHLRAVVDELTGQAPRSPMATPPSSPRAPTPRAPTPTRGSPFTSYTPSAAPTPTTPTTCAPSPATPPRRARSRRSRWASPSRSPPPSLSPLRSPPAPPRGSPPHRYQFADHDDNDDMDDGLPPRPTPSGASVSSDTDTSTSYAPSVDLLEA